MNFLGQSNIPRRAFASTQGALSQMKRLIHSDEFTIKKVVVFTCQVNKLVNSLRHMTYEINHRQKVVGFKMLSAAIPSNNNCFALLLKIEK